MINNFPPGLIMMIGALLIPFLPHIIRQIYIDGSNPGISLRINIRFWYTL